MTEHEECSSAEVTGEAKILFERWKNALRTFPPEKLEAIRNASAESMLPHNFEAWFDERIRPQLSNSNASFLHIRANPEQYPEVDDALRVTFAQDFPELDIQDIPGQSLLRTAENSFGDINFYLLYGKAPTPENKMRAMDAQSALTWMKDNKQPLNWEAFLKSQIKSCNINRDIRDQMEKANGQGNSDGEMSPGTTAAAGESKEQIDALLASALSSGNPFMCESMLKPDEIPTPEEAKRAMCAFSLREEADGKTINGIAPDWCREKGYTDLCPPQTPNPPKNGQEIE